MFSRAHYFWVSKRLHSTARQFEEVTKVILNERNAFRDFDAQIPVLFQQSFGDIPASAKWFITSKTHEISSQLNASYFKEHGDLMVTVEATRFSSQLDAPQFQQCQMPFHAFAEYMTIPSSPGDIRLYLAQHFLNDLPYSLQTDLPTPALIRRLGKGDIYASSLWMGKPPTRTPLHRDPNPNLFVQLAGQKTMRLLRPEIGRSLYEWVQREIGSKGGRAHMRGEEMMSGKETELLEKVVWEDENAMICKYGIGFEAKLDPGDGLYVPLGWWHAVRGTGTGVNASVNWWFR